MERTVLVYVDLRGVPRVMGRLWSRTRRGQESASFEYDQTWLEHPERFALEPALTLGPGSHHTGPGKALFGAIGDSAPDRWGRMLMRRAERRRAAKEGATPRTLLEIDCLLWWTMRRAREPYDLRSRKAVRSWLPESWPAYRRWWTYRSCSLPASGS